MDRAENYTDGPHPTHSIRWLLRANEHGGQAIFDCCYCVLIRIGVGYPLGSLPLLSAATTLGEVQMGQSCSRL